MSWIFSFWSIKRMKMEKREGRKKGRWKESEWWQQMVGKEVKKEGREKMRDRRETEKFEKTTLLKRN